ncbi:TetR family transcriptional regulator, partial [Nonomuraea sp. RK-328]|nr:TetR family transcriptional regulator [Nonomuraea sp. RK-328]
MFAAAMRLPMTPEQVVPALLDGPREEIGERLVRLLLEVTATPETREPMIALIRSAMTHEYATSMFREFVSNALLFKVADTIGVPHLRIEAAFAQMFGVLMTRYVLRLEPMAGADPEELVELLAPTIQRYFTP